MSGDLTIKYSVMPVEGRDCIVYEGGIIPLSDILMWDGLEALMKTLPESEAPVEHIFSGGVYIRQMLIPKGTFIIGKRHRHETCNILMSGDISVYIDGENSINRVHGPMVITSKPMSRKIAYAHSDVIFMNLHPTKDTDLDEIEKKFIITEDEFKMISGVEKCLGEP